MKQLTETLAKFPWPQIIEQQVNAAITEDLGGNNLDNDVTGRLLNPHSQSNAQLLTREFMVVCGIDWCNQVFQKINPSIQCEWLVQDGDIIEANSLLAKIKGPSKALLTAERIAMNFLQTLSATATSTYQLANLIQDLPCQLLDTRKTIPGLRMAQKYAVYCGGGANHRIGLFDRFLIKENHILACGDIGEAIQKARTLRPELLVEIEVENRDELAQAASAKADIIMLDNFSVEQTKLAVDYIKTIHANSKNQIKLESSGNINENSIRDYALTGVDFVSVGAITKSVQAIDLSLRLL